MSSADAEPMPADVSEADWAEQHTAVGQQDAEAAAEPLIGAARRSEADEADVVEQELPAYGSDDEEDR